MGNISRFRCFTSIKWIASVKEPELSICDSAAGNINSYRKVSPLGPGISSNVIIPEPIVISVAGVASTSHIEMPVDDPKPRTAYRVR